MTSRLLQRVLAGWAAALPLLSAPTALPAQNVEASVGRFYDSTAWTSYRLGMTRPLGGVFRVQLHADLLRRTAGVGRVAGLGADLTAFRTARDGPYLIAGVSGGLGSESSNDFSDLWGSWSAGGGYDLYPVSFMSVGAQAQWRQLSLGGRRGLELSLGLALHVSRSTPAGKTQPRTPPGGTARQPTAATTPPVIPELGSGTGLQTLVDSIVATATQAMGQRYTYGGTGTGGEGFDCSGLIQHSYGKHGIPLPRRSVEQARKGKKIARELELLAPADILTFSNRGSQVSHVGLYIGNGRFIHSASRGVQVSILSPDDPYGRWWYKRWVGVRRIVSPTRDCRGRCADVPVQAHPGRNQGETR